MPTPTLSRRTFTTRSAAVLGLLQPALATAAEPTAPAPARALHVVCVGAHPDDPESGCGGTLARFAETGHHVTIVYLTRGEAGIRGKSHDEAAAIRTAEAEEACKILGAKPVFAGQIDGATEVNRERSEALAAVLAAEQADLVFTHWPIDTHPDHQAAGILTIRAHLSARGRFPVYFFEVDSGYQTVGFTPTAYVDITAVREKKKAALFAHRSQHGDEIYRKHHEIMENFRGRERGGGAAEAFVALAHDHPRGRLPGLE
jgi:LmbE family N-acetylglucosaminyl deacetylase